MNPTVSILMPVRNEERFIEATLDSVFAQDYPADATEILVIDGMSQDRTREIIARLAERHPNLRLLSNPQGLQSYGMNLGIREARGEYVVRMDAHAIYAPDYVRQCVTLLQRKDAGEVGGVQRAVGSSYFTRAVALAMGHWFGVGNARFRFTDRDIYAETVYLGSWLRSTLLELGGYSNGVNEEGDLNFRLRKAGYRILVSPRIKLQYIVRKSLRELIRQYAWYGRARVLTLVRHPDSVMYRQLVAPTLVIALLGSALLLPFSLVLGLAVPGTYVAGDLLISAWVALRKGLRYFPALCTVFPAMQLSYGVGFFAGMGKFGIPRLALRPLWASVFSPSPEMPPPGGEDRLEIGAPSRLPER